MSIIGSQIPNYHSVTGLFVSYSGKHSVNGPFGYQTHTVGAQKQNIFGIRMVDGVPISSNFLPRLFYNIEEKIFIDKMV